MKYVRTQIWGLVCHRKFPMSLSHTRHNEYLCILPAPGRHSWKFLFVKRCWNLNKKLQVYCRHNFMVRIFDVFYVSIIMYNRHPDIWWAHLCHPHFVPSSSWWWISWPPCKEVTCFSPRIVSTCFEAKPQLWANKTICWEANRAYKDKLMSCERTNWQLTWKSTCFKKVMECKNTKNTKAHTEIM